MLPTASVIPCKISCIFLDSVPDSQDHCSVFVKMAAKNEHAFLTDLSAVKKIVKRKIIIRVLLYIMRWKSHKKDENLYVYIVMCCKHTFKTSPIWRVCVFHK